MSNLSEGARKEGKIVKSSLTDLAIFDDTTETPICLTEREATLLKQLLQTAYWSKRWAENDDMDLINSWVANIDYKLSAFEECGDAMTCQDVADCIENSSTVSEALLQWNIENGVGGSGNPETPLPPAILDGELLPTGFDCDNDHRYAMCVGIVDYINLATVEVFQAIEVATNPIELSAEITDNIPLAGAAASALDVVAWIQDTAFEAYELYWSETVKDNLACELYCLMQEQGTCTLTYDMIFQVYRNVPEVNWPLLTDNWVTWFLFWSDLALTFGATDNVKVMSMLGLTTLRYGGKFGSMVIGIRSLATTMQLLADEVDPDWSILCTDCPSGWSYDWLNGDGEMVSDGWVLNTGTYDAVNDLYLGAYFNVTTYSAFLIYTFTETTTITGGQVFYFCDTDGIVMRNTTFAIRNTLEEIIQVDNVEYIDGSGFAQWTGSQVVQAGWSMYVYVSVFTARGAPDFAKMTKVTVSGEGVDPFLP